MCIREVHHCIGKGDDKAQSAMVLVKSSDACISNHYARGDYKYHCSLLQSKCCCVMIIVVLQLSLVIVTDSVRARTQNDIVTRRTGKQINLVVNFGIVSLVFK